MTKNLGGCTWRQEQDLGFRIDKTGSKTGGVIFDGSRNQDGQWLRLELKQRCDTEY